MMQRQPALEREPHRAEVDALVDPTVIEFGASWCGYCRAAQAPIEVAWASHPRVRRIRIEDGPGRRLGRSYQVKLWPTLIFLQRGQEVARVVRPTGASEIERALALIDVDRPAADQCSADRALHPGQR